MLRKSYLTEVLIFSILILFLLVSNALAENLDPLFKVGPVLRKQIDSSQSLGPKVFEQQSSELIKVIVVINADHLKSLPDSIVEELRYRIECLGGRVGNHAYNNVQAWLPLKKIKVLAEWDKIRIVKFPTKPEPTSAQSEGISVIGADTWHGSNITGTGVKVGVFDLGFKGVEDLLGTELPADTEGYWTGSQENFISTEHGTACAEIVHDVAPDAQLFLIDCSDMEVDYSRAVAGFKQLGVDVISCSMGLNLKLYCVCVYLALNYDSQYAIQQILHFENIKDQMNATVSDAVQGGITWAQAAGNDGQRKWRGQFIDSDSDDFHDFPNLSNKNEIELSSNWTIGHDIYVLLSWGFGNDLEGYDDFDLYIKDQYGNTVASSIISQSGFPLQIEACKITTVPGKRYFIKVKNWDAAPQEIGILVGCDSFPSLEYYTPEGTVRLCSPASNPDAITVGAVPYYDTTNIEPFSSQGTGYGDVVKPDLVAPDRVSTVSYGSAAFPGTSAAAPHVAGACALVKQLHSNWSPDQIKSYLESNAVDLGVPGKDNVYGSGLVQLPASSNPINSYSINGTIQYEGTPLCAMVLANGQYQFTCGDNLGAWHLDVPLDANGKITLYGFCAGCVPFKAILTPAQALNYNIAMTRAPEGSPEIQTTVQTEASITSPGYVRISGTVTYDETPLCAMVLANGKNMFTCGDNLGTFDLEVPLDGNGNVTLYVFCSGLAPYKEILIP